MNITAPRGTSNVRGGSSGATKSTQPSTVRVSHTLAHTSKRLAHTSQMASMQKKTRVDYTPKWLEYYTASHGQHYGDSRAKLKRNMAAFFRKHPAPKSEYAEFSIAETKRRRDADVAQAARVRPLLDEPLVLPEFVLTKFNAAVDESQGVRDHVAQVLADERLQYRGSDDALRSKSIAAHAKAEQHYEAQRYATLIDEIAALVKKSGTDLFPSDRGIGISVPWAYGLDANIERMIAPLQLVHTSGFRRIVFPKP